MRIVIQRVTHASVTIGGSTKSTIQDGYLILVGIGEDDTTEDADWLAKKVIGLRVFNDENGIMNRSIMDINGEILVVSQFTLMASYKKGNRPSWIHEGEFGADMKVELLNDGPVTICMDTKNKE